MSGYWQLVGRPLGALLLTLLAALGGSTALAEEPEPPPTDLREVTSGIAIFRDGQFDPDAVLALSTAVANAQGPASTVLVSQAQLLVDLASDYATLSNRASTSDGSTIVAEVAELQEQMETSEKLMKSLNETWEQKMARTQEVQREREKALEELGITVEKNLVGVHTPKKVRYSFIYHVAQNL